MYILCFSVNRCYLISPRPYTFRVRQSRKTELDEDESDEDEDEYDEDECEDEEEDEEEADDEEADDDEEDEASNEEVDEDEDEEESKLAEVDDKRAKADHRKGNEQPTETATTSPAKVSNSITTDKLPFIRHKASYKTHTKKRRTRKENSSPTKDREQTHKRRSKS